MFVSPLAYFGSTEIMIVAGIVILLFGGAKMAQFGKGLGEGIREFRESMSDKPQQNEENDTSGSDKAAPPSTEKETR
jgi:sec-independent protein translocase protein TatA